MRKISFIQISSELSAPPDQIGVHSITAVEVNVILSLVKYFTSWSRCVIKKLVDISSYSGILILKAPFGTIYFTVTVYQMISTAPEGINSGVKS